MIGIIILTLLGLVLSLILVNFSDRKENQQEEIKKILPGYNCGGCGYSSCDEMSKAILENPDSYLKCRPLKADAKKEIEMYLKKMSH